MLAESFVVALVDEVESLQDESPRKTADTAKESNTFFIKNFLSYKRRTKTMLLKMGIVFSLLIVNSKQVPIQ